MKKIIHIHLLNPQKSSRQGFSIAQTGFKAGMKSKNENIQISYCTGLLFRLFFINSVLEHCFYFLSLIQQITDARKYVNSEIANENKNRCILQNIGLRNEGSKSRLIQSHEQFDVQLFELFRTCPSSLHLAEDLMVSLVREVFEN